ncbi:dnaJ homolog subfamily C member 28 [Paramormyrops kingsleyae]|uniref:DnaJ (Hsp40) homolog, subfamily C, member 28 n=1 Tax=Paramormyrops kingsleyae TaxID=1676925 RepID=A0A3B3SJD0_9TELE|nr:dnaJ homolog subfamily C member 28 [Paramormyrops kingsleyae]XP_023690526.1 dnaJ homolog subfamily C member 28 [Paramormyrops kingsleyae]
MSCAILILRLHRGDHVRALRPPCYLSLCQLSHAHPVRYNLRECYRLLQLPEDAEASHAQVKDAYLRMAKLYHPDSGVPTADAALFSQIEEAYRTALAHIARRQSAWQQLEAEEEEEDRLKTQSPQHRHYLSYDGVGLGTPSQRERQYRQFRADRATEQVLEYRRRELERVAAADEGAMAAQDVHRRSRKVKITQAVDRLVEDLIQESMAQGDFHNLPGSGKPLNKFNENPYADPMTHNLNRILIDNGYQPQWIVAQKEIRETADKLRAGLQGTRAKLGDPLTPAEELKWRQCCQTFSEDLGRLNKKVDNFNLIVPLLNRQMVHFNLQREVDRVRRADQEGRLEREREKERERLADVEKRNSSETANHGLFSWVLNLLR